MPLFSPLRAAQRLEQARKGTDEPTEVIIREVDTMNLWIWLRMWNAPSEKARIMLSNETSAVPCAQ